MVPPSIRWPLFMALALGSAACGVILGDFPDGQLGPSPDGAVVHPDTSDGSMAQSDAPQGEDWTKRSLCVIRNGVVLDMAVDDENVFWLRGGPSSAVEACPKSGGDVRLISSLAAPPESIALSEKYVFWSMSDRICRADKKGGPQDPAPWKSADRAGPLAVAKGYLVAGTHSGHIQVHAADTGNDLGNLKTQASVRSVTVDNATDDVYYSVQGSNEIRVVSFQAGVGLGSPNAFTTSPAPASFLSFQQSALYWAAIGASGATIDFQCTGCPLRTIANPPGDFASLAVLGSDVYWAANEQDTSVVRGCSNRNDPSATCPDRSKHDPLGWNEKAKVSRIALDANAIYLAVVVGADTYIVERDRPHR